MPNNQAAVKPMLSEKEREFLDLLSAALVAAAKKQSGKLDAKIKPV